MKEAGESSRCCVASVYVDGRPEMCSQDVQVRGAPIPIAIPMAWKLGVAIVPTTLSARSVSPVQGHMSHCNAERWFMYIGLGKLVLPEL